MHRFSKNLVKETIANIVIFHTTQIITNNNEEMVVYLFPIYLYSLCGVKYKKNSWQISRVSQVTFSEQPKKKKIFY